jgi:hypothetical protein
MPSENRFWWPCGLRRKFELISGIAGSNPSESMDVRLLFFVVCCVGSDLCDDIITRSEESYRVCVCARARARVCV